MILLSTTAIAAIPFAGLHVYQLLITHTPSKESKDVNSRGGRRHDCDVQ